MPPSPFHRLRAWLAEELDDGSLYFALALLVAVAGLAHHAAWSARL